MTIRDVRQYKWKSNFHRILWAKIKEQNPDMPNWTIEQLTANGWSINTGTRGYVQLIHKDGARFTITVYIDGQINPHVQKTIASVLGISVNNGDKFDEVKDLLLNRYPSANGTLLNDNTIAIAPSSTWLSTLLHDVPLDTTYVNPDATTSKELISLICNIPNNLRYYR